MSEQKDKEHIQSIIHKVNISINKHNSVGIAIVGHCDCAGNPASRKDQALHIQKAKQFLHDTYPGREIVGLWIDKEWKVEEIDK